MSTIDQDTEIQLTWEDPGTGELQVEETTLPVTFGREDHKDENTIVLKSQQVSRLHARLDIEEGQIVLVDQNSSNGTYVKGQPITRQVLANGDSFDIQPFTLTLILPQAEAAEQPEEEPVDKTEFIAKEKIDDGTQLIDPAAILDQVDNVAEPPKTSFLFNESDELEFSTQYVSSTQLERSLRPDFPPVAFDQPVISMDEVYSIGVPVDETTYLALGGGLGSFTWVEYLRICGVDLGLITVIGAKEKPYSRYQQLCENSQIPGHERLRSDSGSTPDNIWGWPGYAVREAWRDVTRLRVGPALRHLWQIFGEPTLATTYTPVAENVFASIDAEARRIGWEHVWRFGRIQAIRKTDDGRYVVAYSQTRDDRHPLHRLMVANYVHLAVGYPGIQFLPDLQAYREETGDFEHVVNAYEDHDHIYDHLAQHGGTVLVRGRGIVASRVIQRLYEVRQQNSQVAILQLNRSPRPAGNRFGKAQRLVEHHWEFQPFNWPKANWGGDLRAVLESASDGEKDALYNDWGGSTTADRPDWRQIVDTGLKEHWYQIRFGRVTNVERRNGKLVTNIGGYGDFTENTELLADFVIDATGLDSAIDSHPLLKDLLDLYNLERNPKGRLQVANDFEVTGMRNESGDRHGRLYASGVMTLGGPYAPVDSFLGLQYAALRSVTSLNRLKAPSLRRLHGLRSTVQWLKWAFNAQP